jgi:UDP-GlcNAc:undecaprenyl-phosphate GlcNAc-1-phosphate transferase
MPYNLNPATIFMGDTGALLLGYVLSTMSAVGMFKFYAIVSFLVPVLALAVPILDISFAFTRRILRGQNPMTPDRGHFHHRLLDMGMSQKQAVSILYTISIILGVSAVVLATTGELKILFLVAAFCLAAVWGLHIAEKNRHHQQEQEHEKN